MAAILLKEEAVKGDDYMYYDLFLIVFVHCIDTPTTVINSFFPLFLLISFLSLSSVPEKRIKMILDNIYHLFAEHCVWGYFYHHGSLIYNKCTPQPNQICSNKVSNVVLHPLNSIFLGYTFFTRKYKRRHLKLTT